MKNIKNIYKFAILFVCTGLLFGALPVTAFAEDWVPVYRLVLGDGTCQNHLYTIHGKTVPQ